MTASTESSARLSRRNVDRPSYRVALSSAVLLLALAVSSGCENKAIGRLCDVQADGGANQGLWNGMALECPSQICIKQPVSSQVAVMPTTGALCTAECTNDSDCQDGLTRAAGNARDTRCTKSFVCGIAFELGPYACKKLCLCRDFLPPGSLKPPASCAGK
jgi:hypothetical protein